MYALMVRERDLIERLDLRSVRDVSIGSAPLTDALLAQVHQMFPNAQIENGYGTTEAGPAVFGPHPDGRPRPPLSLGYPARRHRLQTRRWPVPRRGRPRAAHGGADPRLSESSAGDRRPGCATAGT